MGSSDIPKAPGAVVLSSFGNFWVEEKAAKVRELLAEADSAVAEDGLVRLTGLESTGKTGDEGLMPYDLSLKPIYIGGVRSMSQASFENMVRHHGGAMPHAEPPPSVEDDELGPVRPVAIVQGMDVTVECCCGHRLASHDTSGDVGGECKIADCPCELFHSH